MKAEAGIDPKDKSYLRDLELGKEALSNLPNSPLGQIIATYVSQSIEAMRQALTDSGRVSSGELRSSITAETKQEGKIVVVNWIFADYWDFVNQGVNGTQNNFGSPYSFSQIAKTQSSGITFPESIQRWIAERGIQPEDGNYEGLAWVIMQSVKRKGIRPSKFVDSVINEDSLNKFEEELLDAFEKMLT